MQKKVAILINEDFLMMRLGVNTSLAYIAGVCDLGYEPFIVNIDNQDPFQDTLQAFNLPQKCQNVLVEGFKDENWRYFNSSNVAAQVVADLGLHHTMKRVKMTDFDLVLQRLDPISPPFLSSAKIDINHLLLDFVNFHQIEGSGFNLPVNCFKDKEFAQNISDDMAIATKESDGVETLVQNIVEMIDQDFTKFVIKPDNLGQSKGVFAINFIKNGLDLVDIEELGIAKIQNHQIHNIKKNSSNLKIILLNLLFCEAIKGSQLDDKMDFVNYTEEDRLAQISKFFSSKILLQPFIEGVAKGDVRVNIAKIDGKFMLLGKVFRKPYFSNSDENFTTCVTSNAAKAVAIEDVLTEEEVVDLNSKMSIVLEKLNGEFAQKYQSCNEIGLDFIVLGDGKKLLLNEANHYCPALMPMAENVDRSLKSDCDGGLFLAKKLINNWLL